MNALSHHRLKVSSGLITIVFCSSVCAQDSAPGPTWERPNADFSKYNRILLTPLDISDVKILKPSWEQDNPEEWSFEPDDAEAVQTMYSRIMSEEISKDDGYAVVPEAGDDVLQLEVEFLSITPFVKPGTMGRTDEYVISTLGSGDVVISAELRDSITGLLLILVEGGRTIGTEYKELSRENHISNLEDTFRIWGERVRAQMDGAHGR